MPGEDRREIDTRVEAVPAAVFWGLTAVGAVVGGFGLYGMWIHRGAGILDVRWRPMLTWLLGALIAHDLLVAPLTLLVGRGLRQVRPRVLRAPLQAGLALSALVTLLAYPLLRGYGVRAGDPSRLPLDYAAGYGAVLAVIWTGCVVWAWVRRRDRTTTGRTTTGGRS